MHELVLRNAKIILSNKIFQGDLGVDSGKISSIGKKLVGDKTINLLGKYILPGAIDAHVHFREPGYGDKEDWLTGSRAAAAGGVTTVLDMPNTIPPTTTKALLDEKRAVAKSKSIVDYGFHFGASKENMGELKKIRDIASIKFFLGSSTGSLLMEEDEEILKQLKIIAKKNIPATVHAEDESIIRAETEKLKILGRMDAAAYSEARPPEAARAAVDRIISLSETAGNRLHICHASTKAELQIISKNKKKLRLSAEATPHHLLLSTKDYKKLGTFAKTNPPLRSEADRKAMWDGINKGIIDIIASDHAPHTIESKRQDIWSASSGVPGVETLMPLMLNEVNKGNLTLARLAKLTSENPAKIFRLKNKGAIRKGFDADLVVVDMRKEARIENCGLQTKCGWSPFESRKILGWPVMTFVRGKLVYQEGNLYLNNGREVDYARIP